MERKEMKIICEKDLSYAVQRVCVRTVDSSSQPCGDR